MWETSIELIKVALTPIVGFIAWRIWRIETNALPHLEKKIANLAGILTGRKEN